MQAKEVLSLLKVTRQTLTRYIQTGKIRVTELPNGHYDYNTEDVYRIFNQGERKTCIYVRTASDYTIQELDDQIYTLTRYCAQHHYPSPEIFREISHTENIRLRGPLLDLIEQVLKGHVERVLVTSRSRISHTAFDFLDFLCKQRRCSLICVSEDTDPSFDLQQLQDDLSRVVDSYNTAISQDICTQVIGLVVDQIRDTQPVGAEDLHPDIRTI